MSIDITNALLNVADRLVSVLRTNINTTINDANEAGSGEAYPDLVNGSFAVPVFNVQNITCAAPDFAPPHQYPAIMIHNFTVEPMPIVGRNESRGNTFCDVRVYMSTQGYASNISEATTGASIERQAMALTGLVQNVVEKYAAGVEGIFSVETTRVQSVSLALQAQLVRAYDISFKIGVRMRHS